MLGKRKGYGTQAMPPHNLPFTMIGAACLGGLVRLQRRLEPRSPGFAAQAFINTIVATAAAVLAWMLVEWFLEGKPTMLGAASGAVAGLVAITPACGWVGRSARW